MEDIGGVEILGDELIDLLEDVALNDLGVLWVLGALRYRAVDYICEDELVGWVFKELAG